ncbi:MAG: hypothetical protein BWY87_01042 [Deltaproteobacteria bacterium ADurb.Bin510]|nr:MAG: hypothetical protein BWY87_01042 [Deltaproteobacteria bacterium ADurb.Bin510]
MMLLEHTLKRSGRWKDVRPVVIFFAGEQLVVEYDPSDPLGSPVVALVHAYLDCPVLGRYEQ